MLRTILTLLIVPIAITSCQQKDKGNATDVFTKVFSTDSIPSYFFTINTQKDTTLRGAGGTVLRIYKNCFADSSGHAITGEINIELKEALTPASMVLGNLFTTSNGNFLESDGMIYVNAYQNNKPLRIADDKIIGVVMPRNRADSNMQVFEGAKDSSGINWVKPEPLLNDAIRLLRSQNVRFTFSSDAFAITDSIKDKERGDSFERKTNEIANILSEKFIDIQQDTVVNIKGDMVQMSKPEVIMNRVDTLQGGVVKFMNEASIPKGNNFFLQDYNTNYVFGMKQLGWANIDRLCTDSRTREVNLVTDITNSTDFTTVYISMILPNKKMYIPGYQKKDNTFSFTHNDEEPPQLPVGEKATIFATAYKNNVPYFAIENIVIMANQKLSFSLFATTMDKLKKEIETGL